MKNGALDYVECVGDDLNPEMGAMRALTFPEMTEAKPNEVVIFSYIVYESREHRDDVNKKVNRDIEKEMENQKDMRMPFDMRKMAYGGFSAIVDLRSNPGTKKYKSEANSNEKLQSIPEF